MFGALVLCASFLPGAAGTVSDVFTVPVPVEALAVWVAKNPTKIAQATGSQIVWQKGNQFQVMKRTPRGSVEATMQHDIRRIQGGYQYSCRLVPGSSDELTDYRLDCRLTSAGVGRSTLTIQVYSATTLRVRDWQLERHMRQSVADVRKMLETLR